MENENKVIECFVDVQIKDEVKRLTIRHNEQVFDAEILVDNEVPHSPLSVMRNKLSLLFSQMRTDTIMIVL